MARPIEGPSKKDQCITFRTSKDLRDDLIASAGLHKNSLAKEIEYRIRRSFEVDDLLARLAYIGKGTVQ